MAAGVVFNFWEAAGAIAGGGSAIAMFGLSAYDRFRRGIRAHALDGNALENHNTRLTMLEKSMLSLAESQTVLNTAVVKHIAVDDELFKNISGNFKRLERGMDQLRAQVRLSGAVRADDTLEIRRTKGRSTSGGEG